jgi:hypothetical protein
VAPTRVVLDVNIIGAVFTESAVIQAGLLELMLAAITTGDSVVGVRVAISVSTVNCHVESSSFEMVR